ncbi:unnamed protein product [Peniophora sp. CBMAI 1063]|nr:unnamed protein product [Peniophora sp. CBMAI 1063]
MCACIVSGGWKGEPCLAQTHKENAVAIEFVHYSIDQRLVDSSHPPSPAETLTWLIGVNAPVHAVGYVVSVAARGYVEVHKALT